MVKKAKHFFVFLFFCLLFSLVNHKTAKAVCFVPKGNCTEGNYQRQGTCIALSAEDVQTLESACLY